MRALLITGLFLIAAACAGTPPPAGGPNAVTACIDPGGAMEPVVCDKVGRTMSNQDTGVCRCGPAAARVLATPCAPGQKQPLDSKAYRDALVGASRDGSIVGDTFEGKEMCVIPGKT